MPFPLKYITKPLAKPEYVDFGDRKIFYVSGGEDLGFKYRFNLPNHEGFKIDKTTGIKNINDLKKIYPFGPMQDFFDIETLNNQLHDKAVDDQDKELILSQILVLHTEYRNLLLNSLELSGNLATYISKTGEWQIRPDIQRISVVHLNVEFLNEEKFEQIANDIKRYFHLEKLFCLNLLGETPDLFDDQAITQAFELYCGRAVIQENSEFLNFLSEDIEKRHQIFRNLMERNYPKKLTVKIFKEDTSQLLQQKNFKMKMIWLEKIIHHHQDGLIRLEKSDPVILKILETGDALNTILVDQAMHIDCFAILSWLQLKASKDALTLSAQDLESEIYELSKTLLEDVPHKNRCENDYGKVVNSHLRSKENLRSKMYAFLTIWREEEALYCTYERAVVMIKRIFNKFEDDRLSFSPVKGDPWNGPADHFWKTFAEEFLEEIEHYLTHLNEMPSGKNVLENQLLILLLKRKLVLEVSPTALLEILHNHLLTQNKNIVQF